jgi:hypothetical protein
MFMDVSNERTQGAKRLHWRLFLGFGYVLIDVFADRLNLFRPLDSLFCPSVSNQSPIRDLMRWLRSQSDVRLPVSHSP